VIIRVIGEIGYDYNFRSFSYCRRNPFLIVAVLSRDPTQRCACHSEGAWPNKSQAVRLFAFESFV